ncbi:MAG: aspartate carbamoyltransferase catalytic subunit [Epsilonproteobacteria bacterium]|nr:aspartate carbamoyltransferase catalytic subunit [Campylobacterota bacterium]
MQHLVDIDDLDISKIEKILEDAKSFKKKMPPKLLSDKLIITLFFEPSTRTRSSFEVAAKRLGASVVHLDPAKSSTKKGETLEDTFANLAAMGPDGVIVRHSKDETAKILADMDLVPVINAGTGKSAHPTQALLDLFTIKEHFGDIEGKKITIVGDIANSRVASSGIKLFQKMGLDITLVAPKEFMPKTTLKNTPSLEEGIKEADIIMSLRAQLERHAKPIFEDYSEYAKHYCIKKRHLRDNLLIMHPGPVMRNIDISDEVLESKNSLVLEQVRNGVFIRMAILKYILLDSR